MTMWALLLAGCWTVTVQSEIGPEPEDTAVEPVPEETAAPTPPTPEDTAPVNCDDLDLDGHEVPPCGGDCDDAAPGIYPGAPEVCDGVDQDCSGRADDPFDLDGDGVSTCAFDCDDGDAAVFPGNPEQCNGLDDDCDFAVDEGFDVDFDRYTVCDGDCDDADPFTHPDAAEACDGDDDDCNGTIDDAPDGDGDGFLPCDAVLPDCDDADPAISPLAAELCDGGDNDCDGVIPAEEDDVDGDGWRVCAGDCDDLDATRSPGETDLCNGIDDDCEPATSEFADLDGDGLSACDGDCNDGDPLVVPGAAERCNAGDDDCAGDIDEGGVCGNCGAVAYEDRYHVYCPVALPYDEAEDRCAALFGLHLTSLADSAEELWVADTAWYSFLPSTWYIGLDDQDAEGLMAWRSGANSLWENFANGEPNDFGGNEDCTEIMWSGYEWNDRDCAGALPYICGQ